MMEGTQWCGEGWTNSESEGASAQAPQNTPRVFAHGHSAVSPAFSSPIGLGIVPRTISHLSLNAMLPSLQRSERALHPHLSPSQSPLSSQMAAILSDEATPGVCFPARLQGLTTQLASNSGWLNSYHS